MFPRSDSTWWAVGCRLTARLHDANRDLAPLVGLVVFRRFSASADRPAQLLCP